MSHYFKTTLDSESVISCNVYDGWVEAYHMRDGKTGYPALAECPIEWLDKLIETLQEAKRIIELERTP